MAGHLNRGVFLQTLKAGNVPAHAVLATALARLDPSEVLISDRLLELPDFFGLFSEYRERLSVWPKARFNLESALATLLKAYQVKSLDVFGDFPSRKSWRRERFLNMSKIRKGAFAAN